MRTVEFHRFLNDDYVLRVKFDLEPGRILKFVVQLECRLGNNQGWAPHIIDTHGLIRAKPRYP